MTAFVSHATSPHVQQPYGLSFRDNKTRKQRAFSSSLCVCFVSPSCATSKKEKKKATNRTKLGTNSMSCFSNAEGHIRPTSPLLYAAQSKSAFMTTQSSQSPFTNLFQFVWVVFYPPAISSHIHLASLFFMRQLIILAHSCLEHQPFLCHVTVDPHQLDVGICFCSLTEASLRYRSELSPWKRLMLASTSFALLPDEAHTPAQSIFLDGWPSLKSQPDYEL